MNRPAVRDSALFLARAILGLIFIAHGWRIIFFDGVQVSTQAFAELGIPQPGLSVWLVALFQLLAGGMLVVGLLTTFIAGALLLFSAGLMYFVHLDHGLFAAEGGMEYPLVLAVCLVLIIVFGAGRASVDGVLSR